ncbi:hypothetical protein PAPYR_13223 [Paratrimastix pyriformis]|uniref:Uncharacterized protein n=1 Tax=Paratrimastix pyriformis TaxID=342808 RepID=A0ABQ8U5H2_9EUKA|nr:hypothetical protein PAPYR_13223 [Paratrimastix pyriformis]
MQVPSPHKSEMYRPYPHVSCSQPPVAQQLLLHPFLLLNLPGFFHLLHRHPRLFFSLVHWKEQEAARESTQKTGQRNSKLEGLCDRGLFIIIIEKHASILDEEDPFLCFIDELDDHRAIFRSMDQLSRLSFTSTMIPEFGKLWRISLSILRSAGAINLCCQSLHSDSIHLWCHHFQFESSSKPVTVSRVSMATPFPPTCCFGEPVHCFAAIRPVSKVTEHCQTASRKSDRTLHRPLSCFSLEVVQPHCICTSPIASAPAPTATPTVAPALPLPLPLPMPMPAQIAPAHAAPAHAAPALVPAPVQGLLATPKGASLCPTDLGLKGSGRLECCGTDGPRRRDFGWWIRQQHAPMFVFRTSTRWYMGTRMPNAQEVPM